MAALLYINVMALVGREGWMFKENASVLVRAVAVRAANWKKNAPRSQKARRKEGCIARDSTKKQERSRRSRLVWTATVLQENCGVVWGSRAGTGGGVLCCERDGASAAAAAVPRVIRAQLSL